MGSVPTLRPRVIQGRQAFGCSGWRDGCSFVLQPTWNDQPLTPEEIRRLLQRRSLLAPRPSSGGGDVILTLTDTGCVTEIPLPSRDSRPSGRAKALRGGKSWSRKKPRARSADNATAEASLPTKAKTPRAAPQKLGVCPCCGADVLEQKKSYSCSRWREGCPFVIWKTIAGKRISVRLAQSLLTEGQTELQKGFRSKAGKPFEARLKLVEGHVKLEFQD
jgi:DNA topoisomerase III